MIYVVMLTYNNGLTLLNLASRLKLQWPRLLRL